jgi:hypothetical protein
MATPFFNQYAYGIALTLNLDFDPSGVTDNVKLSVTDAITGVEVLTATQASPNLNLGLGQVGSVWPVVYTFAITELDTVGFYLATLFLENAGDTVGQVLTDGYYEVRAVPSTAPW